MLKMVNSSLFRVSWDVVKLIQFRELDARYVFHHNECSIFSVFQENKCFENCFVLMLINVENISLQPPANPLLIIMKQRSQLNFTPSWKDRICFLKFLDI